MLLSSGFLDFVGLDKPSFPKALAMLPTLVGGVAQLLVVVMLEEIIMELGPLLRSLSSLSASPLTPDPLASIFLCSSLPWLRVLSDILARPIKSDLDDQLPLLEGLKRGCESNICTCFVACCVAAAAEVLMRFGIATPDRAGRGAGTPTLREVGEGDTDNSA